MSLTSAWFWGIFALTILMMLAIDIIFVGGKRHRVSTKEALSWVIIWMSLAAGFAVLIYYYYPHDPTQISAHEKALEFVTGYLIEWSLSIDNLFVFLMIFNYFKLPVEYQRRILLLGVLGAIFFRFIFITIGVVLVARFHWILYLFGILLIYTGFKIVFHEDKEEDLSQNLLLKWMRKHLRITHQLHQEHFIVKHQGLWSVTPLFVILVMIEISDILFAIDSIPAIFAVTSDPFIIFTSNIFAIMGLRAMYFLLARMHEIFHLLKHGVGLILIFIGIKMLLSYWYLLPVSIALGVILTILLVCITLSLALKKKR